MPHLPQCSIRSLLLLLLVSSTTAYAQSGGRAPRDPSQVSNQTTREEITKRGANFLAQCMQDWEPSTHMSRQEWRRTCERVAKDRLKFLLEQAKDNGKK